MLSHARNTDHDGYQVFCEEDGTFGAAFLVGSNGTEQTLKVSVGEFVSDDDKIVLAVEPESAAGKALSPVTFRDPNGQIGLRLSFPSASPATEPAASSAIRNNTQWKLSEGGSLWFEANDGNWRRGGRISPNQDDMDLEYWWQNNEQGIKHASPTFLIDLRGTTFEDPERERTWILTAGGWQKADAVTGRTVTGPGAIAVVSACGTRILCMAWPRANDVISGQDLGVALQPVHFPLNRRYHIRGKVYLLEGNLEILKDRIGRETTIF